jgi:hypothetical protein
VDFAKKCRKIFQVQKSENRSISSICSGREVTTAHQKLNTDVIRRAPEPGVAEIIIDRAGWENGQNVESRVAKKLTSGSISKLRRHAGRVVIILESR